jgi:large subunit ribosomal protein L19
MKKVNAVIEERTMSDQIIQELKRRTVRDDIPQFTPGDTVAVHVRVVEGQKERIQIFKGTVVAMSGRGANLTFTVRKISSGIGVERIFPVSSPSVAKVEVEKEGGVRRSKLYYLRDRVGKKETTSTLTDEEKAAKETVRAQNIEAKKAAKAEKKAVKAANGEATTKPRKKVAKKSGKVVKKS